MTTTPVTDPLLTSDDVAAYLNVSLRYVRRLVAEQRLPYLKIGAKVRFTACDVEHYLASSRREVPIPLDPDDLWETWMNPEKVECD